MLSFTHTMYLLSLINTNKCLQQRMYNWEIGITPLVKESFTRIATKRFRGIVSQAKHGPGRPYWITPTLWTKMWEYWDTPEAQDKSSTASACRNSERGGLGLAKHVAGQKSFLRVQQEMVMCLLTCFFTMFYYYFHLHMFLLLQEEECGHPVSYGDVFKRTHTSPDGSFIDFKAKEVFKAYDKQLAEVMDEASGPEASSQQSTQRTLSIDEKNAIFLKVIYSLLSSAYYCFCLINMLAFFMYQK